MKAIKYYYYHPENWDAIVNLMDDDIREDLHNEIAPCGNAIFLTAYCDRHFDEFGEEFEIN